MADRPVRFERPRRNMYLAASLAFWILGLLSVTQAGQPAVYFWWALISALMVWPVANAFCYLELRSAELVVRNFFATMIVRRDQITGVTEAYVWGSPATVAAAVLRDGSKLQIHAIYLATGPSQALVDEAGRRVEILEGWVSRDP